MGTFIKNLDLYLDEQEELADEQKHLQQKKLKDLIAKINSTDIAKEQKQEIIAEAEKLFPHVTVSFTSIFEELLNAVKVMPALTEADKIVKPLKTK